MASPTSQQNCHVSPHISCGKCRLSALCLPMSLQIEDIGRLDQIIQQSRPVQKNDTVYYTGEKFNSIFAVRSSAIKTFSNTSEGREQIGALYLPGETIETVSQIMSRLHKPRTVELDKKHVRITDLQALQSLSIADEANDT